MKSCPPGKTTERAKRLDAEAEEVKKRLENKESFDTVAASVGTSVQHLVKVVRATTPIAGLSTASIAAAFDGPKGLIAVADGDKPMTKVVLTVDDVVDPPYDPNDKTLVQTKQTARRAIPDRSPRPLLRRAAVAGQAEVSIRSPSSRSCRATTTN